MSLRSTRRRFLTILAAAAAMPVVTPRAEAAFVGAIRTNPGREAFVALYDHFGPRIWAFYLRSGIKPAIAVDLTHEVMSKIEQRAHQFDPTKSSFTTWVFRIVRNTRIDYLRQQRGALPVEEKALSVPDAA
jgi:RNA polymerase sigma-70 factor (ECF subfamily)